jgi:hypothetical protein
MSLRSRQGFPMRALLRLLNAAALVAGVLVLGPAAGAASVSHIWSMDEPNGTGTMNDDGTPTQTDGKWTNIQAGVPGFDGTAYRFGGNSRVTVADDPSLDPGSSDFTATAHVRFTTMPTSAIGGDYDLIRKGLGSSEGGYWKVEIFPDSTNTTAMGRCQMKGSSGSVKITNSPSALNDGTWHTITCAKTGSNVSLTVDGTNYSRNVTIGRIANDDPVTLGSSTAGKDWYSGDMDEVSLQMDAAPPPAGSPTITSFSPISGAAGSSVTITGTNFTGATSVEFGGIASKSVTVDSSTQITAVVPAGAVTGPIGVGAPSGTAVSSTNFTVLLTAHHRSLSLSLRKHLVANGTVTVRPRSAACKRNVPVRIQWRVAGTWRTIASTVTDGSGFYRHRVFDRDRAYRAVAPKIVRASDVCRRAVSPTVVNT